MWLCCPHHTGSGIATLKEEVEQDRPPKKCFQLQAHSCDHHPTKGFLPPFIIGMLLFLSSQATVTFSKRS